MRRLRTFLACLLLPVLAACSGSTAQSQLDAAKLQMNLVINGTIAAANVFLAGTAPAPSVADANKVKAAIPVLMTAQNTLNSITVAADWQSAAQQALSQATALTPLLAPVLGPYAQYMPAAIAIVQSFIQTAAVPPSASTPPANLSVPAAVAAPPAGPVAAPIPTPPTPPVTK